MIQHAHFCCKHSFASLCLQIEHMHASLTITSTVFCCFDFTSTYNHSATNGKPIEKKTMIVLIGIRRTNNEIPKHSVPMPRTKSQRVPISIVSPEVYISLFFNISLTIPAYLLLDHSYWLIKHRTTHILKQGRIIRIIRIRQLMTFHSAIVSLGFHHQHYFWNNLNACLPVAVLFTLWPTISWLQ
jgi:hypothetical protein